MRVIVSGALANKPWNGGEAWVRLSWIRGIEAAGGEVTFLEQIAPEIARDAVGRPAAVERSENLRFFEQVAMRFGLSGQSALLVDHPLEDPSTAGPPAHTPFTVASGIGLDEVLERVEGADLLVNISGHLRIERLLRPIRRRAYVDLDPGFTQFWHAEGAEELGLERHDVHFTVGENVGRPNCSIPTSGLGWLPVRQPVSLDEWRPARPAAGAPVTTVASWRGAYGPVEHRGRRFGVKAHEFRKVIEVPRRVAHPFEIALDIHPADRADRARLLDAGWRLADPREVAPDPDRFREYVRGSAAEFSPAQGIYVETRSGWFSDRTVRYLAAGRPAIVQDTGLGDRYPTGDGLLRFSTLAEAAAVTASTLTSLEHHSVAARQIAEELFEGGRVCADFLDRATAAAPASAGSAA